jgi:hypothetical protein
MESCVQRTGNPFSDECPFAVGPRHVAQLFCPRARSATVKPTTDAHSAIGIKNVDRIMECSSPFSLGKLSGSLGKLSGSLGKLSGKIFALGCVKNNWLDCRVGCHSSLSGSVA